MAKASKKTTTKKTTSKNSKKVAEAKTDKKVKDAKAAKGKKTAPAEDPISELITGPTIERPVWSKKKGTRRHERKIEILNDPIVLDPAIDAKYVADVIDFEKDIEPFKVIEIISGVGSGKNYWVETELAKKYRVLEITSRRKTADAQAYDLGAADKLRNVEKISDIEKGLSKTIEYLDSTIEECKEKTSKDAVITYYQMELYCRFSYPSKLTVLADYFDFIIFDEFHATIQDAGFQTSSPSIYNFITQCIEEKKEAKIILMTATPNPVKEWVDKIEELVGKTYFNPIDLYDECHHVITKQLIMHPYAKIKDVLNVDLNIYQRKVLYFTHTLSNACDIVKLVLELGIPEEKIGIDFADDYYGKNDYTVKDNAIPEKILENRKKIKKSLKSKKDEYGNQIGEYIPDNIQFLVSTGVNREGINIRNKDIDSVYIESMNNCEVNQLLGRLRNGVRCAHLLFGYKEVGENPGLRLFIMDYNYSAVKGIQEAFQKFGPGPDAPPSSKTPFINDIYDNFEYVAWDGSGFVFNWYKTYEHELRAKDILELEWVRENWDEDAIKHNKAKEKKQEETDTSVIRAREYFELADSFENIEAMRGYTEEEIQTIIEERGDMPGLKEAYQELLTEKEELVNKKKKERDYGDITGKQFLQTYWFPYSELFLDPSLYYESIADFKYIIEAVNRTMIPWLGKTISKAESNKLKQQLEIALYNRGMYALNGMAFNGYLASVQKDGTVRRRNLLKHDQLDAVLKLFGYTAEDTAKSHEKGKTGKNYLIRRWETGDECKKKDAWKPHDDVIRLSGVSDFGRPDIEADMNIETYGELIEKGLAVMPSGEKPGLSSIFYDMDRVAEAFPDTAAKGTKKKAPKKETKKRK